MEERRFDELTRVLGAATSRRQVLKGVLGVALGSALASLGWRGRPALVAAAIPTCNGVTYDPSTQCCEPAGIQPRHPIANLDLCPNRVPHPGHVPSFNGCGPEKGFKSHFIPNRIGPTRNVDFTPACNHHDICYDTCNSDKATCDLLFLKDLTNACMTAYPENGWYQTYMRTLCIEVYARAYYTAVAVGGESAYEDAQKEACDCCPACQDCTGPTQKCCNYQCTDVSTDAKNCGDCGHACPASQICSGGTCQCPDMTCPPGQTLDPDTCQCVDRCANVTCTTCQTCDPTSGACVQAPDQTACGNGQVCCQGICQDTCNCPAGQSCGDLCCPSDQGCVGTPDSTHRLVCCPLISVSPSPSGAQMYPALPDGSCCSGTDYWVENCDAACGSGGWVCCASQAGGCCPCGE